MKACGRCASTQSSSRASTARWSPTRRCAKTSRKRSSTASSRRECGTQRRRSSSTRPAGSSSAGLTATPASPAARSSSTRTAARRRMGVARFPERIRPRSIGRRATWRGTSPSTSVPAAWAGGRCGRWRLGTLKKLFLGTAALVAAVVVFAAVTLPPARLLLPAESDGAVPGIVHVHTIRSDGRGTPDEIAAAAARAGLKFVVFTDHGDATRTPDRPMYRSGVLCLDAVEISTTGGHYIAIDMPASPYPLGGEARDVVEDVKRLGGFGIAAHPDSP